MSSTISNLSLAEVSAFLLAVYGLSWLLVEGRGPYDVLGKLRELAGVRFTEEGIQYAETELGLLLSCDICTSLWVGLLLGVLVYVGLPWFWLLPLSGVGVAALASR